MRLLNWVCGILALALACSGAGCNRKIQLVKVEGVVTLDGKPFEGATVTFIPEYEKGDDKNAKYRHVAHGRTGKDGVFHLTTHTAEDGAVPGDYKVTIMVAVMIDGPNPASGSKEMAKEIKKYLKAKASQDKNRALLPAEYEKAETTPLRCTVPPQEPVQFELRRTPS